MNKSVCYRSTIQTALQIIVLTVIRSAIITAINLCFSNFLICIKYATSKIYRIV